MSSELYPRLEEPWSDIDDEGIGPEEDTQSSSLSHRERGNSGLQNRSCAPRDTTVAVNLLELEDHYLRRSSHDSPAPPLHMRWPSDHVSPAQSASNASSSQSIFSRGSEGKTRNYSVGVSFLLGWVWCVGVRGLRWAERASLWKKALLAVLLGLLSSMIVTTLRRQLDTHRDDNYLPCPSQTLQSLPPCIPDSEVNEAKLVARKMTDILQERAAHYICGTRDVPSLTMSLDELKKMPALKDVSREDIRNVFYLILVNPHWNIRWMDSENKTVSDWTRYPMTSDLLVSSSPSLPIMCSLLLKLSSLWSIMQWLALIVMGAVMAYALFALYQKRRRRQEADVYAVVTIIMDLMKYHYKKSCTKKDLLPFLAIVHVRDILIPPSERKAKERLWNSAVEWIASHESRVRVETRRIAGQDFEVWRWIQEDPPPTEIPSSKPSPGGQGGPGQGNWHGSVFDHYPPEITTQVAPPTGIPSVCIRLKNMFEPVRRMSETQIQELENAVLERCHPHRAVVHVWVDKKSPVGCVYLKMASLKTAKESYNALHGGWYKGKLVTAKYIPEAKYHKWFPAAVNAKTPITLQT